LGHWPTAEIIFPFFVADGRPWCKTCISRIFRFRRWNRKKRGRPPAKGSRPLPVLKGPSDPPLARRGPKSERSRRLAPQGTSSGAPFGLRTLTGPGSLSGPPRPTVIPRREYESVCAARQLYRIAPDTTNKERQVALWITRGSRLTTKNHGVAGNKKKAIELYPDAWARFERAIDIVAKSPPQHRTKIVKSKGKGSRSSVKQGR
jgi:hypothetical protein